MPVTVLPLRVGSARERSTTHGDTYEPKLAAEIASSEVHGWDRGHYAGLPAWPRPVRGAGPAGPSPRTVSTSRALRWRDRAELVAS
ncbi:MAG: hypothetical protein ACYDCH_07465 [Gaiellaceae bacterium]